jgi:hypothetical protein
MRRWLVTILSAFSLFLCLILLYGWIRSYLPRQLSLECSEGRLLIMLWDGNLPEGGWQAYNPGNKEAFGGFTKLWEGMRRSSDSKCLAFQYTTGTVAGYVNIRIIAIPLWFLVPLCAAMPTFWFLTFRRQRRRNKLGRCLKCGYDLRESTEKCPECGTAIPASAS